MQELDGKGLLYDTVVVALGANGSFSKSTAQELLNTIGSQRRIYWVSPYGKNLYWTKSSFDILNELEAENENLIVLNWPELAKQNENWFISDGMHLNEDGQTGYANFLFESLTSNLKNNE